MERDTDVPGICSASGHLSEMFNGLDVNGTGGQVTTTPHIDVRRASSSSSGGSAPISPLHDGSSSNANHIAGNNGLNGNEPFSSPASTISAGSHKAIAVPQVNEMAVYGYHQGSADDGSVGMSGDSSPTLMYPPPHGDPSRNANGGNGNTLDGVVTFTNPFNTETTYDTSSGYGSGFTGMDDSSMVVGGSDQGGGGGGGAGTLYGAIELSHMCVPANMGAMGGFGMTESFMPYS